MLRRRAQGDRRGRELADRVSPGHFERIHHVRKKYACAGCETNGENPRIETAAKPETAIDKGLAGPGLLAYIVTSKFTDYLPLYRLEDIFARQGFEISRATQSVWCGDVADLVEPLYELMAERGAGLACGGHRRHHHAHAEQRQSANARMWVYVGDEAHPYNVFDFTLSRGRDGPKYFLKDYEQVLLADAYGGYNGVVAGNAIVRAGCWAHLRRKIIEAEKAAPEIAREAVELVRALYAVEKQGKDASVGAPETAPGAVGAGVGRVAREVSRLEGTVAAQASHGRGDQLCPGPMEGTERVLLRRRGAHRQQRLRTRDEARRAQSKELFFVGNARGGRTAAILASLTTTCRRHDVDPQLYLTQLLINLPATRISELPDWLPDQWKLAQTARLASLQSRAHRLRKTCGSVPKPNLDKCDSQPSLSGLRMGFSRRLFSL